MLTFTVQAKTGQSDIQLYWMLYMTYLAIQANINIVQSDLMESVWPLA